MKDKKLPKLLVSKTEASEKIRDRINIGKELYKVQISSEQQCNNLSDQRSKWVDYNKTLLDTLFDKSPLNNKWHGYSLHGIYVLNDTLSQQFANKLKSDIDSGIKDLESIHEQLELYQETTLIREKLLYVKSKVITKIKKLTKKHLLAFLGAIITSVIAGIILFHIGC